mgnify:CR=1 FL=1
MDSMNLLPILFHQLTGSLDVPSVGHVALNHSAFVGIVTTVLTAMPRRITSDTDARTDQVPHSP